MSGVLFKNLPIVAFILIWVLVGTLFGLQIFTFHPVSLSSLVVLVSGIAAVIGGYLLACLIYADEYHRHTLVSTRVQFLFHPFKLAILTLVSLVFLVTGGLGAMSILASFVGGVKYYLINPILIRETVIGIQMGQIGSVPFTYSIFGYMISIGMLSPIFGGALMSTRSRLKFIGLLPFLGIMFASIVFVRRYTFVTGVFFWVFAYTLCSHYFHPQESRRLLKRIIFMAVIIFGLLFGFSFLIVQVRSFWREDVAEYFYRSVYAYFVGGLSSLDVWLDSPYWAIEHTFGQATFRDIFKWLARLNFISDSQVHTIHQAFVSISPMMKINTYTFVKSMYEDFNIYGVLGFSFLWGFVSKYLSVKFFRHPTYLRLLLVTVFTFSLFMSFYSFYFRNLMVVVFWLIFVWVFQGISTVLPQPAKT